MASFLGVVKRGVCEDRIALWERRLTAWADAPKDDVCFKNAHAVGIAWREAGGCADGAGHVFDAVADNALYVVVVVVTVQFVVCAAIAGELNSSQETACREIVHDIVCRLQ